MQLLEQLCTDDWRDTVSHLNSTSQAGVCFIADPRGTPDIYTPLEQSSWQYGHLLHVPPMQCFGLTFLLNPQRCSTEWLHQWQVYHTGWRFIPPSWDKVREISVTVRTLGAQQHDNSQCCTFPHITESHCVLADDTFAQDEWLQVLTSCSLQRHGWVTNKVHALRKIIKIICVITRINNI